MLRGLLGAMAAELGLCRAGGGCSGASVQQHCRSGGLLASRCIAAHNNSLFAGHKSTMPTASCQSRAACARCIAPPHPRIAARSAPRPPPLDSAHTHTPVPPAGMPEVVPVRTVNRQCSSGLQAIADVAAAIRAGYYTIGLAGGVETMSAHPMSWEGGINPRTEQFPKAASCLIPMGVTSENVAAKYGVDRASQDAFAVHSHAKAAAARGSGKFRDEIVPVSTVLRDPKTGAEQKVVISEDDGIREGLTREALGGLRPVFKKDGTTTAGNSSQVGALC